MTVAVGPAQHSAKTSSATAVGVLAAISVSHLLNDTLQSLIPVDLSAAEVVAAVELLADRPDHADAAAHRLAAPAGGRDVHRSAADAVFAGRRDDVLAGRTAAAVGGVDARRDPVGGRADGRRIVDLSPGVVAHRPDVVRRAPRPGAVGVPGRRQPGIVARPAARGVFRGAARPVEPGVVRADCDRRDRAAAQGRPLVGASSAAGGASAPRGRLGAAGPGSRVRG